VVNRLNILIKWCALCAFLFVVLSFLLPDIIACVFSCMITVGALFHPDNEKEYLKLKRPILYIKAK